MVLTDRLGKKFAEMEFVTCVSMVVQQWRVSVGDGWSEQQVLNALDASVLNLTFRPAVNIPFVFTKR